MGFRYGLLILVPVFVVGGLIVASAGGLIDARRARRVDVDAGPGRDARGPAARASCRCWSVRELVGGLRRGPGARRRDIEIGEGEIVALLGTNGAGKSTLLRAIGGVVEADHGAVVFDGRDITHAPPDEIARLGIAQVPGGEGVFPNLRVEENLRAAAWQRRRRGGATAEHGGRDARALPALRHRAGTNGPATSRAASSRCWRWPWP